MFLGRVRDCGVVCVANSLCCGVTTRALKADVALNGGVGKWRLASLAAGFTVKLMNMTRLYLERDLSLAKWVS